MRPMYRSSLKAIFLVALARCSDIDSFGIDLFLKPFVEDLKLLYIDGISVKGKRYHGALVSFLADTQAAHKVGGFKGSVSFARRICRTCMATKEDCQTKFDESEFILRTPESHEQHCQSLTGNTRNDSSIEYGINRTSILEEVPGFSVVACMPHDIMHDLFEGVVHYELKLLLHYCLSRSYFTIEALNVRIQGFDFGYEDRPSLIDPKSLRDELLNKKFAAQTISLVRNLSLIIGDKVPREDRNWHSMLVLIKICQIALSPIVCYETLPYLRLLVTERLQLLKELYPLQTIKPKMHYMVHYASQVEKYGPLLHSWTMRHEAKLSFIKRSSRRGNFKNILKTVVKHHQQWLCYQLHCENHLLYFEPELSPQPKVLALLEESDSVQGLLMAESNVLMSSCLVHHYKWVKFHSFRFNLGSFVLLSRDDVNPVFGKVVEIIQIANHPAVLLYVERFIGISFSCHYNAYVLQATGTMLLANAKSLQDYHPYLARKSFNVSDHSLYVSMPYSY